MTSVTIERNAPPFKEIIMSVFDAPIGRCEVVHEMVLLDETRRECACEHGCPPGQACPLAHCFARRSGLYEAHPEFKALIHRHAPHAVH